jgi:hypothetical protein
MNRLTNNATPGDEISKVMRCSYYFSHDFIRIQALGMDDLASLDMK